MNKKITVRLPDNQINYLNVYANERSITFSSALREHILIASRKIKDSEENERKVDRLESIENTVKQLNKSIESLKEIVNQKIGGNTKKVEHRLL